MPWALRWMGARAGRVPIVTERLTLGRAAQADVVLRDARIQPQHARMSRVKGEWVIAAEAGAALYVNGVRAPLFALRHGDVVDLTEPSDLAPVAWRFEDRMDGAFVPPGALLLAAWLAHPASRRSEAGPGRYRPQAADAERGGLVRAHDPEGGGDVALWRGPPGAPVESLAQRLEAFAALAGGPHPGLAPLRDAGVAVTAAGPMAWSATDWIEGASTQDLVLGAPRPWREVLRLLVEPARALAWLHRRGLLHRAVSPDHLVRTASGAGVLAGLQQAAFWKRGVEPLARPTPWTAPEERGEGGFAITPAVDVYGLLAVAHGLLAGDPPPAAAAPGRGGVALRLTGPLAGLPEALGQLLLEGLAALPAHRPNAADVARRLEALAAAVGDDDA